MKAGNIFNTELPVLSRCCITAVLNVGKGLVVEEYQ